MPTTLPVGTAAPTPYASRELAAVLDVDGNSDAAEMLVMLIEQLGMQCLLEQHPCEPRADHCGATSRLSTGRLISRYRRLESRLRDAREDG